jgi:hypothetical protein
VKDEAKVRRPGSIVFCSSELGNRKLFCHIWQDVLVAIRLS